MLKAHQMTDANSQSISMKVNVNTILLKTIKKYQTNSINVIVYKLDVNQLMYFMIKTRSNIVYAVCKLSIFNVNSTAIYWKTLKRVLQYLADTRNRDIIYGEVEISLCEYTNVNWVGD